MHNVFFQCNIVEELARRFFVLLYDFACFSHQLIDSLVFFLDLFEEFDEL